MEFEDRCHKVQEPKFDCLLFGMLLLTYYLLQNVAVHSFISFFVCLFLSVVALLLPPLSLHGMQRLC